MELVVEFKSVYAVKIDDKETTTKTDWTKFNLEIDKIGIFNKPKLNVRNLTVKIIKTVDDILLCKINNELVTNIWLQKEIDKQNGIKTDDDEYRQMEKQRLSLLRTYNNGKDKYTMIPVTTDKLILATPTDGVTYYYMIYLVK
ncbi:MAG: hypothetical protein VZS44_10385 [Bacilli bacterium]|nr:hypothetical protein [Bacilli bacterium]